MADGRRRRRKVIGAAAAVTLVAFVAYAPGWAIDRAPKSFAACSNRDYEDRPDVEASCDSTAWLWLPLVVPWKREEALQQRTSIRRGMFGRRLKLAASFRPDRGSRSQSAEGLAHTSLEESAGEQPASDGLLSLLAVEGDAEDIRRHRSAAVTPFSQNTVLRALLALGALDDAVEFARNPPALVKEDYDSRELFLSRGILLCLAGEREAGLRELGEAERVHAGFHQFSFTEARVARRACGQRVVTRADDRDRDVIASYDLGKELSGRRLDEMLIDAHVGSSLVRGENRSPFVAAALAERPRPLSETLALLSTLERLPSLGVLPVPWLSRAAKPPGLSDGPLFLDPERHELAAKRLEALSEDAPVEGGPSKESREWQQKLPVFADERLADLEKQPRAGLRRFAWGFWLEAAAAWAAEGRVERMLKAGARAVALDPSAGTVTYVAPMLLGLGRFDDASKLLAATSLTDAPASTRALSLALSAQALAHQGHFAKALDTARSALEAAEKMPASAQPLLDPGLEIRTAIGWLVLGLALHQGDTSAVPELRTPVIYERDQLPWPALVALAEPERAVLRWRMRGVEIGSVPIGLPAELFVVGEAARGGDVEVWLDHALGIFDHKLRSAPGLRARGEAARWRGDSATEADYAERARRLEKQFADPNKRALASLLDL